MTICSCISVFVRRPACLLPLHAHELAQVEPKKEECFYHKLGLLEKFNMDFEVRHCRDEDIVVHFFGY